MTHSPTRFTAPSTTASAIPQISQTDKSSSSLNLRGSLLDLKARLLLEAHDLEALEVRQVLSSLLLVALLAEGRLGELLVDFLVLPAGA
jgi:hypothetical protein